MGGSTRDLLLKKSATKIMEEKRMKKRKHSAEKHKKEIERARVRKDK